MDAPEMYFKTNIKVDNYTAALWKMVFVFVEDLIIVEISFIIFFKKDHLIACIERPFCNQKKLSLSQFV